MIIYTTTADYCFLPTVEKKQVADSWRNHNAHATDYWTSDITFYGGTKVDYTLDN